MLAEENCDRLAERLPVLLRARCRKSSWHVFAVEIGDLSQGGCSIVGSSEAFLPGELVRLSLAHLKPIEAEVRWLREDKVGVEFRVALKARVIEQIAQAYAMAAKPSQD